MVLYTYVCVAGTTYRRRHGGRADKHHEAADSKAPADKHPFPFHAPGYGLWVRELIFNRVWPLELSLGFNFSAMHLSSLEPELRRALDKSQSAAADHLLAAVGVGVGSRNRIEKSLRMRAERDDNK